MSRHPETRLGFFTSCVNWPEADVHRDGGLCDLIDACEDITRRTFLSHVRKADQQQLETELGYERGDSMFLNRLPRKRTCEYHGDFWNFDPRQQRRNAIGCSGDAAIYE